jgi:hypothetical protein
MDVEQFLDYYSIENELFYKEYSKDKNVSKEEFSYLYKKITNEFANYNKCN